MNEQERLEKIEENKRIIAELEAEIKALKGPASVGELITEPLYGFEYNRLLNKHMPGQYRMLTNSEEWTAIRRLCVTLFFRHGRVSMLNEEQKKLAAQMADEIIRIRNKYFKEVHNINEGA